MRTTLTLDKDVADFLCEQSRLQRKPFTQVVNETLRRGMSPVIRGAGPVYRVKPLSGGFRPGVASLRLNQLNDALETQSFTGGNAD